MNLMDMERVTYAYISEPVEFRHLEGKPIDFRKTFDVRGHGEDEMLQLYLQKAHITDDVEKLPALQRRAYVYDIIRSNKAPGYWVPPCMQVSSDVFAQPPPAVLPPPSTRSTPGSERRLLGDGYSNKMNPSSSSNSLSSFNSAPGAMPGPSFGTSVLVSNKGSKYEISGPINFQHVSGDVTRDRTRNAFDLNAGANDNVLKKYMMEHNISEEDVAGIKRQELIKKIVHSNFTWMPRKQDLQKPKTSPTTLQYATISTNNQITPPHSPAPSIKRHHAPQPPNTIKQQAPAPPPAALSNYASVTSRFVDISDMDMPMGQIHERQQEIGTVVPVQLQQSQPNNRSKVPPPPSEVTAVNTRPPMAAVEVRAEKPKIPNLTYATIAPQTHRKVGTMRVAPPAPPKPSIVPTAGASTVQYAGNTPPPPVKSMPVQQPSEPRYEQVQSRNEHVPNRFASAQPRNEPVQSHNEPVPNRFAPVQSRSPPAQMAPLPKTAAVSTSAAIPPPPPPPPPMMAAQGGAPPPPPPPPAAGTGAPMPPPPPPVGGAPMPPPPPPVGGATLPLVINKSEKPKAAADTGDNRDAFLASIRQGVQLKKVDKKAATISGIKPRAEKKPATTDFLSELKLGITLRRVKNPADNPFSAANADESQA